MNYFQPLTRPVVIRRPSQAVRILSLVPEAGGLKEAISLEETRRLTWQREAREEALRLSRLSFRPWIKGLK